MKVFVAGATGAIGKQLVPRLVAAGHEVHGMTHRPDNRGLLAELGAVPVVADALDPDQVADAVGRAQPDVVVHQLTEPGSANAFAAVRCVRRYISPCIAAARSASTTRSSTTVRLSAARSFQSFMNSIESDGNAARTTHWFIFA